MHFTGIATVPPGTYTLIAWHEMYGTSQHAVTIGSSESRTVDFTFQAGGAARVQRDSYLASELARP